MDMDFAMQGLLVPPARLIEFLFIDSHVCSTLLSDLASQRRPCASLALHLHQVGQKTFTSKLLDMPSTLCAGPSAPHLRTVTIARGGPRTKIGFIPFTSSSDNAHIWG